MTNLSNGVFHLLAEGLISDVLQFVLIGLVIIAVLAFFLFFVTFGKLWLQAISSGCPIPIFEFVGMYLRRVPSRVIVDSLVTAHKAGIPVDIQKLQAHVLARGNVRAVIQALVAASRAGINLTFDRATAIDLAGRDVLDAVRTSVNPKVIDCPHPGRGQTTIDAVAKNGIQLKCKARVTVRTNLARLVGGATEETVTARVGQGIVAAIGMAEDHKEVLANPSRISRKVLEEGLDAGTAFEIVSIDIADIDVGENIGAKLMTDQAEAQKKQSQAEAEAQRARAVARGQEMEALQKENRSKVILAEAEIPKAIAESFRSGNLGVMDYYNLLNLQSDTRMRNRLGSASEQDQKAD
ncbi:MAG: flotillin-like protein FloA [Planctomycetes bacterium]|nr:flotillin-like protein FloA [Planctomycetota bacterium]